MKLQHWITILALLAMGGFALGCGEDDAEESTETPAAETPPEETAAAEEAPEPEAEAADEAPAEEAGGEAAGGGSACERAQSCCEAYVEAVAGNTPGVSVETTCAGVQNAGTGPAADTACENMITGWRTSLDALPNVDTPSACAGSGG